MLNSKIETESEASTEIQNEALLAPQGQSPSVFIPFNRLKLNPENRINKHSKTSIKQRAAEILEMGVLQNLVVTPEQEDGLYMIQAGNGRYLSVAHNVQNGLLSDTYSIECKINNDLSTDSIKLAENSNRQNLHPVEEFQAFSRLINDEGKTVKEVANSYGRTVRFIKQRLKLAELSPVILKAFLSDDITLETAEAFTLTDDKSLQESVWSQLSWDKSVYSVKRLLLNSAMLTSNEQFEFVGMRAYTAAGGVITSDLFGDSHSVQSPEIIAVLVQKKLDKAVKQVVAENYSFVTASFNRDWSEYPSSLPRTIITKKSKVAQTRVNKLSTKLNKLQDEPINDEESHYKMLETCETELAEAETAYEDTLIHSDEEKAVSGVSIYVKDGKIVVIRGVLSESYIASKAKAEKTLNQDELGGATDIKAISGALTNDLVAYKTVGIKISLLGNVDVSKDLLLFNLLDGIASTYNSSGVELEVSSHDAIAKSSKDDMGEYSGTESLSIIRDAFPQFIGERDRAARFSAFCNLKPTEKNELFCLVASNTLSSSGVANSSIIDIVSEKLNVDYREHWCPTKANYFGRIGFDLLKEHAVYLCGLAWLDSRLELKKSKLADELSTLFQDASLRPEGTDEKFQTFVPEIMR
jgi:ParB family chromosome partitioning protein